VSIFRYAAHSARSFNLFTQASADRWNNVLLAAVDSFATDGFWSNTLWPHIVRFDAWQSSFGLSLSSFLNWPQVVNRWQSFFRLSPKEEVEKTAPGLEPEDDAASLGRLPDQGVLPVDRESLKAEIRQEIFNELKQASWFPPLVVPPAGVVVFPEVGNESQSRLTQDIIGSFSDEVQVQFDEGGRSGVIIPKFKNSFNERYIFILTPIKTGK
jgi:hypothetical protein